MKIKTIVYLNFIYKRLIVWFRAGWRERCDRVIAEAGATISVVKYPTHHHQSPRLHHWS